MHGPAKALVDEVCSNMGCPVLAWFWLGRGSCRLGNANPQRHPHTLALSAGPFRLDFHHAFYSRHIMPEAAPRPVFRFLHESALEGLSPQREQSRLSLGTPKVAMYVAQFLDALLRCPNVEIVIARLPEVLPITNQSAGHGLFDG